MKDKNIIRTFTFLSVILLFISFSQKAFCVDEDCGESWSGLMCFLLGIFSLIFSLSGISWLLNPFMIISYIIPIKNIKFKLAFSALALTFGLSFLLFDEIIKNEAGHYGKITGYEIGYWIWILSAVINLTGILIVKLKNNKNTHHTNSKTMTGSWNEIFDKNSKIILGIMILLIFLLMILLSKLGYFENNQRDKVLNQNYKTVVVLKFYDKPNHNTPKIKLSNGKVLINYWHWRKQNIEIKVGDIIIKEKMSTNLLVKRNSKLVYSLNLLEVNRN